MERKLRVGLVGCGAMGNEHLNILAAGRMWGFPGVCDERSERARRMAALHGTPCWTNYPLFLAEGGPDVVHICSQSGLHAEQALLAAEAGFISCARNRWTSISAKSMR